MKLIEFSNMGPVCKFGDAHVYYALHVLNERGTISRSKLSVILGVGEGSVRKIVGLLKGWKLIDVRQSGILLTDDGRTFLENVPLTLVDMPESDQTGGPYSQGILLRGMAQSITNGMDQRDSAVVAGATGASVFMMDGDVLTVSNLWQKDSCPREFSDEVRGITGITEDDALVVTNAPSSNLAVISAIASGLATI